MADYYLLDNGVLKRNANTLVLYTEGSKKRLPVNRITSLHLLGRITVSSQALSLASKQGIIIHYYNYHGGYQGTYYPRDSHLSGYLTIKQAEHYLDHRKRLALAEKFVKGAQQNMLKTLSRYGKTIVCEYPAPRTVQELMAYEGNFREKYYNALDQVLPTEYRITKRTRRPPQNKANAAISFGNMLLYSKLITLLYATSLNPTISYLHEPLERRFSLALDVSEVFKPVIVDRSVLKLILKKQFKEEHFRKEGKAVLLTEKGKALLIKEMEDKLSRTILHKNLKKRVSYYGLMRIELYKLIKHFVGQQEYKPFVSWW